LERTCEAELIGLGGGNRNLQLASALMSTLQQCIESLSVCHVQDEPNWPAARTVAQQDIDAYLQDAGSDLSDKLRALELLAAEFARAFPDESDPVLIRSYIRRHMRRIGYELQRQAERTESTETISQVVGAPATVPVPVDEDADKESEAPMTEQQRLDIARLCHEAQVPDKSGEQLSAQDAQALINDLREKAAEVLRK
jgi:hypothetical protein